LVFLPVHAAGLYSTNTPYGLKLSDFVASSYTPSLPATTTDNKAKSLSNPKILAVALPKESRLPQSEKGIHIIETLIGPTNTKILIDDQALIKNVQKGTEECSYVHFACHGEQDASDLAQSFPLSVNGSKLPHSRVATCKTAVGKKNGCLARRYIL